MNELNFNLTNFDEYWQNLTIADDFIFCKVFQDTELCREMLEILLDIKIDHVEYPESQKEFKSGIFSKGIRLDVFVQDSTRVFDVEIQTAKQGDLALRTRYYHSAMDTGLLQSGQYYTELKESYVIFLCMFDPIGKGLPLYNFRTIEENHPDIFLNDKRHTVLYNINAFAKLHTSEKRALLEYIALGKKNTHFANRLESRVLAVKNNDDWRIDKMTYEMKIHEAALEARKVALAEGLERGANEQKILMAERMLSRGFSYNDIVDITGLSLEEIEGLRA
ncbi:MAG: Rpn family recombination-promoting nuclease/putative transposase [Treponema sp.]|nr:Rpn family recombination-promoting nuclease/putative transposase [Treponema sp.]